MSLQSQKSEVESVGKPFVDLHAFWQVLRKDIRLILVVAGLVFVGVVFYTLEQTRIYRTTATLQIDPSPPSPLGHDVQTVVKLGSDSYWDNREYYETQFKILQSRRVAEDTVKALGLQDDKNFLANLPADRALDGGATPSDAAGALLDRLVVAPVKETRLVKVSYDDADPERGQRVLTGLINTFLDQNVDDVVRSTSSASDWLRDQLGKLKDELETSELALHKYKKTKQILSVSLEDQSNMLRDEMQRLNQRLTEVRATREHLQSRAQALESIDAEDPVNLPSSELLDSSLLSSLRETYLQARSAEASLLESGKGENHPAVQAATAKVATTREALVQEIENVRGAINRDLTASTSEVNGLSGLLERAKQQALDLNLLEIEYGRLERSKVNTEKMYTLVLERFKESDLTGMLRFNNIRVVEHPLTGNGPVEPRIPFNLGLGLVGGLGLGILFALGRHELDRSLRGSEDVERELHLSCLGYLPRVNEHGPTRKRRGAERRRRSAQTGGPTERLAHDQPTGGFAEAVRIVRTNLLLMSPDTSPKTLLVTSSQPSEGKTTVASALAITMAQAGERILLVDCDLRQSRLHHVFDANNDVGVTGLILDGNRHREAITETEIPNLSVLPAGPRPPNPAELLHSKRFSALVEELTQEFDRVIIDSPPVSLVSDASILGAGVDAAVFVVRAGKTSRDGALKATRALSGVGTRIAGVVLNALDLRRDGYYGYGRYYGHKYYGAHASDNPNGAA